MTYTAVYAIIIVSGGRYKIKATDRKGFQMRAYVIAEKRQMAKATSLNELRDIIHNVKVLYSGYLISTDVMNELAHYYNKMFRAVCLMRDWH